MTARKKSLVDLKGTSINCFVMILILSLSKLLKVRIIYASIYDYKITKVAPLNLLRSDLCVYDLPILIEATIIQLYLLNRVRFRFCDDRVFPYCREQDRGIYVGRTLQVFRQTLDALLQSLPNGCQSRY